MKIIISPTKKMRVETDSLSWQDLPLFLDKTEQIYKQLHSTPADELQKIWKCNDKIAALNVERLQNMDLYHGLTPAIPAYNTFISIGATVALGSVTKYSLSNSRRITLPSLPGISIYPLTG